MSDYLAATLITIGIITLAAIMFIGWAWLLRRVCARLNGGRI